MKRLAYAFLLCAALLLPVCGLGEYDAQTMEAWLARFCEALTSIDMQGNPAQTVDPARPGEYLLEYPFGTVTARVPDAPKPADIVEIDVRTQQVTDCRGKRVGMTLDAVTDGQIIGRSSTQLYVLSTQEAGLGFAWAYLGENGVYGVEFITYGGSGAAVQEYTLTYVLDGRGMVSAIRIHCAQVTDAQAQQAMDTAEEIAQRQWGEVYAVRNSQSMLLPEDLQVMGVRALGMAAAELVAAIGEPVEVQTLPEGRGRLLLYEGATVSLGLNEKTGEEVVTGVNVSDALAIGPRGLTTGMSVQEAASLFRCDEDVYAVGGTLYLEGEAAGDAPYGELIQGALSAEAMLRYGARAQGGRVHTLEIGVRDSMVTYWRFFFDGEGLNDGI